MKSYRVLKAISLGRLVVALLLAVVIWGYIITTQYPEDTIPINNVSVQTTGLSSNLIIRQMNPQTVKVNLSGAKDKVNLVQFSSVQPVADLSACKPGTCEVKVTLRQVPDNVSNYSIEPDTVQVQLEEFVVKEFEITINKIGSVRPGYQQDEIKLSKNTVTVSGPKTVVDRITSAQVTIDLGDRDTSLVGSLPVVLLNANNQPVEDKNLKTTPETVNVNAPVSFKLNAKTVPIRVLTSGQPALGYIAGSITTEPNVITLNGDPSVLDPIKYVDAGPVDLTNVTADLDTTAKLVQPGNTAIIGSTSVKVHIGIAVAQASVPVEIHYDVINVPPNNLRYEVRPGPTVSITLQGPYQLLQPKLPLDQIKATVDLNGLREGTHEVPLQVTTPAGLVATNLPKMTVIILAVPRPTNTPAPLPTATPSPTPALPPNNPLPATTAPVVSNPNPTTPPTEQAASPIATTVAAKANVSPSPSSK